MTTLFDIAQNWLNQDPDAETCAELTALFILSTVFSENNSVAYFNSLSFSIFVKNTL